MTFLIILEIREILCSFRLVLEQRKGDIPELSGLEFLEKKFQQIIFLYPMQNTTPPGS